MIISPVYFNNSPFQNEIFLGMFLKQIQAFPAN